MKIHAFLLSFYFISGLIAPRLHAQSIVKIDGYVVDWNGMPLDGANVVVVGTAVGASTNENGYFAIENLFAGEYDVQAGYLGFQSQTRKDVVVSKESRVTVHFRLLPMVIRLREIVVKANKPQDVFSEIMTAEDIQKSHAETVGEILRNVPGVEILQDGGGSGKARASIHGSRSNQVLVLLDGVSLNDPLIGDVDLNQIPLSNVGEIRVSKGGGGSRFGNGSLGGVIEILSRKQVINKTQLHLKRGAYGRYGIQPSVSGEINHLDFWVNADFLTENSDYPYVYEQLDGTQVSEKRINADFTSQNVFGKLRWSGTRHAIQFQTSYFHSQRGLPGLVFGWTPYADADTKRFILNGHYAFKNKNRSHKIQLSRYSNRSEFLNTPPPRVPLRFRSVPPYHTSYAIVSYQGSFESEIRWRNRQPLNMQLGLKFDDFQDKDLAAGTDGAIRKTNNVSADFGVSHAFMLPVPSFLTDVRLTTSLRVDYFHFSNQAIARRDHQVSPQIGLLLSRKTRWAISWQTTWDRSFREPTFADLFFQDFRVRGNADLQPEKSRNFTTGLKLGLPITGWLETTASYFRNSIKNLIQWELGSFATWQPFNTDALLSGLDLGLHWTLCDDHLRLTVSHVILDARDRSGRRTTNDKRLTYRPKHTSKLGVQIKVRNLFVQYQKRITGERFVTPANTVHLPSYSVDDLTVSFMQKLKKLQMTTKVSAFNLFSQRYEIVEGGPMPGRTWRVGVELSY